MNKSDNGVFDDGWGQGHYTTSFVNAIKMFVTHIWDAARVRPASRSMEVDS